MDILIFPFGDGWGYSVGGVYQEYDPEKEGFVLMTKQRAEECAAAVLARLEPQLEPQQ